MGFLGKIKDSIVKAFDRGGVDIDIEAPDTFRWSDGTLPVTVTLSGDDTEQRLVTALEFELVDELIVKRRPGERGIDHSRRRRRARQEALKYRYAEPITLAPGAEQRIAIEMPLSAVDLVVDGGEAPEWLSKVGDAVNLVKDATRDDPWFSLKVRPRVDGFNAAKVASVRIRNLRTGEWGGRMGTISLH